MWAILGYFLNYSLRNDINREIEDELKGDTALAVAYIASIPQQAPDDSIADRIGMMHPVYTESLSYQRMFGRNAIAEFTGGAVQGEIGNSFIWGASADKRFGELVVGGGFSVRWAR